MLLTHIDIFTYFFENVSFTEICDVVAPELSSSCLCVKQQEIIHFISMTQRCCKKQLW